MNCKKKCKNKNAKKGTPKAMGVGNTKKIGNSPQISEVDGRVK